MPLPTAYDETTLADYMVTVLSSTAAALGWDSGSDPIFEAVNEVAGLLGGNLATTTDVLKVRALARWQAWKSARSALATQYNLSSGGDSLTRSQWYDHAGDELYDAASAASVYAEGAGALSGGAVLVTQVSDPTDPYGWPAGGSELG